MVWLESAFEKGVGEQQGGVVLVPAELVAIHLKEEWSWSLLNWSPSPLVSFLHFFTATNWHFDIFEGKIAF